MNKLILAAAASSVLPAVAPAAAAPALDAPERYTVAIAVDGLDLSTPAGLRTLRQRAAATSAQVCGMDAYGIADQAAVTDCRTGFRQAFRSALAERLSAASSGTEATR
jgi:UrcA family protein